MFTFCILERLAFINGTGKTGHIWRTGSESGYRLLHGFGFLLGSHILHSRLVDRVETSYGFSSLIHTTRRLALAICFPPKQKFRMNFNKPKALVKTVIARNDRCED